MARYLYACSFGRNTTKQRAVMEAHLGRRLHRDEYVHHVNEDKHDNRLENLVVMDKREHGRLHHLGKLKNPSRRQRVMELLAQGLNKSEIARREGVTRHAIIYYARGQNGQ